MITTNIVKVEEESENHELHKNLGLLNLLKYDGSGSLELLKGVCKVYVKHKATFNINANNQAQIGYAKHVWNECKEDVRHLFLPSSSKLFMRLAAEPDMANLIEATLSAHQQTTGTSDARARYESTVSRYQMLITKSENEDPFGECLTTREEAFILRFEAKQAEKPEHVTYMPNQNAVTYVYLMIKVLVLCELDDNLDATEVFNIAQDILKLVEMQGNKTQANFVKMMSKFQDIQGKISGVDIKPLIETMIEHDDYVTASSDSKANKLIANTCVTMKRLHRCAHIFTHAKTAWGLLDQVNDDNFSKNLIALFEAETLVNIPDKKSLAIVWYLCIGRQNMSCVIVDHRNKSAGNILANLLGKPTQDSFDNTDYVFPVKKKYKSTFAEKIDTTGVASKE